MHRRFASAPSAGAPRKTAGFPADVRRLRSISDTVLVIVYQAGRSALMIPTGTSRNLGPVDKPDPAAQAAHQDESDKTAFGFVEPHCNPALLLQVPDAMLDTGAERIQ